MHPNGFLSRTNRLFITLNLVIWSRNFGLWPGDLLGSGRRDILAPFYRPLIRTAWDDDFDPDNSDTIKYNPFTRTSTDLIMKNTNIHRAPKQRRKHVYVYHWNRIIGAVVLILVLGGLAGFGLSLWSDTSPKKDIDMAETPAKAAVAVEETRSKLKEEPIHSEIEEDPPFFTHAEENELPPAVAEITDSSSNSQDTEAPILNDTLTEGDNLSQQFAKNNPLETEPPSPELAQLSTANHTKEETIEDTLVNGMDLENSEPAAQLSEEMLEIPTPKDLSEPQTETPHNMSLDSQGESPDSADTTITVDMLNSPFILKKLEILEPSVKRFLLARSVSNREPEGELNEIRFTADGSATVWAYSEVIDKKGSRLKYVWLHGGNQIATVPVDVGSNRWRSFSNKLFNQSMSGAWRVELQDGQGRLMASADFFLE